MGAKKELPMATALPELPQSSKKERKVLRQAEINASLWEAVDTELSRLGLTTRDAMEWGLQAFLLTTNPKKAAALGIVGNKPS